MRLNVVTLPTASKAVVNGSGLVTFATVTETSGAASATVEFYDGHDTGGQFLGRQVIPQSTTVNLAAGGPMLVFRSGLYLNVVSGTFTGVVTVKLTDSDAEWAALVAALGNQ